MLAFDVTFAFVSAGAIGWRARGDRRDLALLYAAAGVGVPGLAFLGRFPAWDLQYFADPALVPASLPALFMGGVLGAGLLGHAVGARRPQVIGAVAAALGLFGLLTLRRTLLVGDYAQWQAGTAPLLPAEFLTFAAPILALSGALLGYCMWRAGQAAPFETWWRDDDGTLLPVPLLGRERRALVALTRAAVPPGETLDVPVDEADVVDKAGLFLASLPYEGQVALRSLLAGFEWTAVVRHGRPFSSLTPEQQSQWVLDWAYGRRVSLRMMARLLLTVVKPAHIRRRAVQAQLGIPPERLETLDAAKPEPAVELPPERVHIGLSRDTAERCQVVVVGSGAGGAVAAAELAERGVDVVLIEEGLPLPLGTGRYEAEDHLRDYYRDGGATVALGRPSIPIPLGMTVGGSTTINSGTCMRAPDSVLARWAASGLPADPAELADLYARVEGRIGVQPTPAELLGGSSHVIARGAEKLGYGHRALDRNIRGCRMSAVCVFGCPTGAKQSMERTYVPSALASGARLYAGLRVTKILVENGRAVGVVAQPRGGGAELTVRSDAVVSACGTISTPSLLRSSGLRGKHLGRHLTMHPASKVAAEMPERVDGWLDTPQGYGIDGFVDEGLMFEGAFVPPSYAAIAFPFAGKAFTQVMERYPHLAMFGAMIADGPNGRVYRGAAGRPVITYNMSREDLDKMRKALRVLSEVFFAAGAERIFVPISGNEVQETWESARALLDRPLDPWSLELVGFHPLGTARMSARMSDGVVRPDLQCWDLPGLYVMDGSVLPSSLGVNPQMTIMAYATRGATALAERLG